MTDVELLAALLRTEPAGGDLFAGRDLEALRQAAIDHDVLPLVVERIVRRPDAPAAFRRRLAEDAHAAVVVDLLRERELTRAVEVLARAGVAPLIVKGSHLAYTHYARPDLRSRIDSDLLIAPASRRRAHEILTGELGYDASNKVSGDLSATQQTYTKSAPGTPSHSLDLHWRLASPQVFAHVLSYGELMASSVALPSLGPAARGPSDVHALVIACIHRIAHHDDEDVLKWFVDIHLVASRMSAADWQAFIALVSERRVATICRYSLVRTVALLQTPIPPAIMDDPRLQEVPDDAPSAAYLKPRTRAQLVVADLRALESWSDRGRLLREHLFPSAVYMRTMYAPGSGAPLAWLYAGRIVLGARKWLFGEN